MPIYDIQDEPIDNNTADNTKAALQALGNFFTARKQAQMDAFNQNIRKQGMAMMASGNIPEGFEGDYDTATGGFKYKFKGQDQKSILEQKKLQQEIDDANAARQMLGIGQPQNGQVVSQGGYKPKKIKFGGQEFESPGSLTASQELAKDKAVKEIYETVETNKARKKVLDKAIEGSENVPSGWLGKKIVDFKNFVGSKDPMLEDAQDLKIALTMGTLAETAFTKGAISDSEMMLFKQASANNDFNSVGVRPVLAKIRTFLDSDQAGKFGSFKRNYGEDPATWFENQIEEKTSSSSIPEFASESDIPEGFKGKAKVGGVTGTVN